MREHFWFAGLAMAALGAVQLVYPYRLGNPQTGQRQSRARQILGATGDSLLIGFGLLLAFGRIS